MTFLKKKFIRTDIVIQLVFIFIWLCLEFVYSILRNRISSFFISFARGAFIQALITIIIMIIIRDEESKVKKYKIKMRKSIVVVSGIIFVIALLIFIVFDFNKPLSIYWQRITGDYALLEIIDKAGSSIVNVGTVGNKVCLDTRGKLTNTTYWLKFSEDKHDWRKFKEIYFYIKYDNDTKFSRSAMLKVHLNNVVIIPKKWKTMILGAQNEIFMKKSKGSFYFPLEKKLLMDDNTLQVTLNSGRLDSFCLEAALIR